MCAFDVGKVRTAHGGDFKAQKKPRRASVGDWIQSNTLTVKLKCCGVDLASETYLTVTVPLLTLVPESDNLSNRILDCVNPS